MNVTIFNIIQVNQRFFGGIPACTTTDDLNLAGIVYHIGRTSLILDIDLVQTNRMCIIDVKPAWDISSRPSAISGYPCSDSFANEMEILSKGQIFNRHLSQSEDETGCILHFLGFNVAEMNIAKSGCVFRYRSGILV